MQLNTDIFNPRLVGKTRENMEVKERNKIYRKALELNVNYEGYDHAVRYLKTIIDNYDIRKVRLKALPELALFDYKINYNEINKYEAMKIRDIALMFCIEITQQSKQK